MRVPLYASAAALAAALIAAPAFAADTMGQADVAYSAVRWKWGGWPVDNTDVAVSGAVAHTFDNGWGVQLDGRADDYQWDGEEGTDRIGLAAAHVYKQTGPLTVGGFAGRATFYGDQGTAGGVEARVVLPRAVVQGSVGRAVFEGGIDYGLWDAQVSGRWYLNDDLSLGAAAGWTEWDDAQRETGGWNGGLEAEWKPAATLPVSLFAAARRDEYDFRLYDYSQDTLTLGVRVSFGAATLRERDSKGPLGGAQALAEHLLHY